MGVGRAGLWGGGKQLKIPPEGGVGRGGGSNLLYILWEGGGAGNMETRLAMYTVDFDGPRALGLRGLLESALDSATAIVISRR